MKPMSTFDRIMADPKQKVAFCCRRKEEILGPFCADLPYGEFFVY